MINGSWMKPGDSAAKAGTDEMTVLGHRDAYLPEAMCGQPTLYACYSKVYAVSCSGGALLVHGLCGGSALQSWVSIA